MTHLTEELKNYLDSEGYTHLRVIPNLGICGLYRFMFTVGLVIEIDEYGYKGRYCYNRAFEASKALEEYDGIGDPGGDWIKYKGVGGERSRLNEEVL